MDLVSKINYKFNSNSQWRKHFNLTNASMNKWCTTKTQTANWKITTNSKPSRSSLRRISLSNNNSLSQMIKWTIPIRKLRFLIIMISRCPIKSIIITIHSKWCSLKMTLTKLLNCSLLLYSTTIITILSMKCLRINSVYSSRLRLIIITITTLSWWWIFINRTNNYC